jgi:ABC-type polar amino acid transport system ATPase subunit
MIGEVLEVMEKMAEEGMTMVVVSHEMGFIREAADRVLMLADGLIVEEGSPQEIFNNPKQQRTQDFLGKIL